MTMLNQLCELTDGEEGDFFALLVTKEESQTRQGKHYFRVTFRDAHREVSFPIWGDSPLAADCDKEWVPGEFYKLRATYRETNFGPQLDIRRIRIVSDEDYADGFHEGMCLATSTTPPEELFAELIGLAETEIQDDSLRTLVTKILSQHRETLLLLPAATRNHHVYAGGFLEHVLSVTHSCIFLSSKYKALYPQLDPQLNTDLVIAGAILHDIGKLAELEQTPTGPVYTPVGELIGHVLLGRDLLLAVAEELELDPELCLRLEHVIVSHQRLPEWGSPKPPMTPEALIVHYADDLDAKFEMMSAALSNAPAESPFTSHKNALHYRIYRGSAT